MTHIACLLALTGMIARNSVILIDQIEKDKAKGLHPWDAVVDATMHRVRPIMLTAAAAILGMVPIAPTVFFLRRWRPPTRLASAASSFVTGQVLVVDGGITTSLFPPESAPLG